MNSIKWRFRWRGEIGIVSRGKKERKAFSGQRAHARAMSISAGQICGYSTTRELQGLAGKSDQVGCRRKRTHRESTTVDNDLTLVSVTN